MDRRSLQRIGKIEEQLSAARKEREGRRRPLTSFDVWHHATAVAAIVLSGKPKVDEPLSRAWARALQHYGVNDNELVRLATIIGVEEIVSARFTEIFRTAPVWLLQFTGMAMDARLLKLHLPDISKSLEWGSAGYEDARRWPGLPRGTMTAGNPIPKIDARRIWLILFCMIAQPFLDLEKIRSRRNAEKDPVIKDPILKDIFLALDLDGKPEHEWSRYEKRRMRKLSERFSLG